METPKFTFKTIYIYHVDKGYTAYIKGLDGVVSQGSTKDEARANLLKSLSVMVDISSEEAIQDVPGARIEEEDLVLEIAQ